jgi:hypothetical protein
VKTPAKVTSKEICTCSIIENILTLSRKYFFFLEHARGLRIISLLEEANKVQTHPDFERKTMHLLHEKATHDLEQAI